MPLHIISRDNSKIKAACKLRDSLAFRRLENSFLAEGLKLCRDLATALHLKEVYVTEKAERELTNSQLLSEEYYVIAEHVAEKLADTKENQGVFCVFELPEPATITKGRWVALENVQDPGNVGAILRVAAAFGFDGAILSESCADAFSQKALRASMGASARLALQTNAEFPHIIEEIKAAGNTIYAAALRNSVLLNEVDNPEGMCLVIGSEGCGITEQTIAVCDQIVRIPITRKTESLNASVAAGILMWHFRGVEWI